MSHTHACVWVDHREARIFGIGPDDADEIVVHDHTPIHHLHGKADHVGHGKAPVDRAFLAAIADALTPFKALLIVGPGTARTEFAGYLSEYAPQLAKKVWGIEPMDHPTENQIAAAARKFFKAADRMHG